MANNNIVVKGAGIAGIWAALSLVRAGHKVCLVEKQPVLFADAASALAGAMIAPYCEVESAEPRVQALGLQGLAIWRDSYPGLVKNGTLVLAPPRDRHELSRFARMTEGHQQVDGAQIEALEPALENRFSAGLFFHDEAHLVPRTAMEYLLAEFEDLGGILQLGAEQATGFADPDFYIDCTGISAQDALPGLRGVRGEMLYMRSQDVQLARPVRLLHPRFPLYVAPQGEDRFMIGASMIENAGRGPVTVRSALELLSAAYSLIPAFAEAEILGFHTHVRPAFADNMPRIHVRGSTIYVNGLFRHGFLLAPVLAQTVTQTVTQHLAGENLPHESLIFNAEGV